MMSRNPIYKQLIRSKEWKLLRIKKLKSNPLCEQCKQSNKIVPATEVHHVIPVESVSGCYQMKQLMFQYSNLKSLCHCCHVEIHRQLFSHTKESVQANNKRRTESFVSKYLR